MAKPTLATYQQAERALAREDGRRGFSIHAAVTAVVCVGLIALNVFVAPEFPWAMFPVLGMTVGLYVHWHFGVARLEEAIRQHQDIVERKAA